MSDSIAYGFGFKFANDQKHIPFECNAKCSLVTVKIQPNHLRIFDNNYKIGEKRASFTDATRHSYDSLSITDRGFPEFVRKHQIDGSIEEIQQFYSSHEEIYLRVGVSRRYCPPRSGNDGYWLQVNGIYGYPEREFPL